jgi:hypothetical protein
MANILARLPFDVQEHILVKVMKQYKLRDGKFVRQIDKSEYAFLDYIMRPSINKHLYHYHEDNPEDIFDDSNENKQRFHYKFNIKNLYDNHLREDSNVEDDMVDVQIEHKNNIYYYEVSIFKLKLKNIENNFTPEKMRKDIYHKGAMSDNYFWNFFEFSYEVK